MTVVICCGATGGVDQTDTLHVVQAARDVAGGSFDHGLDASGTQQPPRPMVATGHTMSCDRRGPIGTLLISACIITLLITCSLGKKFREAKTRKGGPPMGLLWTLGTMADILTITLAVTGVSSARKSNGAATSGVAYRHLAHGVGLGHQRDEVWPRLRNGPVGLAPRGMPGSPTLDGVGPAPVRGAEREQVRGDRRGLHLPTPPCRRLRPV